MSFSSSSGSYSSSILESPIAALFLTAALGILTLTFVWYLAHYQPYLTRKKMSSTISDKVLKLCTETQSVSDLLAKDPSMAPEKAMQKLFGGEHNYVADAEGHSQALKKTKAPVDSTNGAGSGRSSTSGVQTIAPSMPTEEDLERARQCGKFEGTQPSKLFLQMFHDALVTLEHDPLAGVLSPSKMASTGVVPLTVIGPVWDICRHMGQLIVRAEREVFFATNYWMASDAAKFITDAMIELNKRAEARGQKVVFKMMYDRGNIKQLLKNHQPVSVAEYTSDKIKVPSPSEIPFIDLQVVNYHRPALGTFHSKFMVVDRKYGIVQSNNIQKNDNLEMMTQLEGPIVDGLYDVCLNSWFEALKPSLPCLDTPAATTGAGHTFDEADWKGLFDADGKLKVAETNPETVQGEESTGTKELEESGPGNPKFDSTMAMEYLRINQSMQPTKTETHLMRVNKHLNAAFASNQPPTAPNPETRDKYFTPLIPLPPHAPVPMAFVNRKPAGAPNNNSLAVPQNFAWRAGLRYATKKVFIQSPNINAKNLLPEILAAVRRGIEVELWYCLGYNDSGELLPGQNGTNEMNAAYLRDELKNDAQEVKDRLKLGWYVAKDQNRVIHKKEQGRSCHIKLMIVDDQVGIQGNGNQDTQSWYHSQEINIMIDSALICDIWMDGILRNENTEAYGMGSPEDGLWRDKDGNFAKMSIGKDPGKFAWAKGIVGAVQRARGVGGF